MKAARTAGVTGIRHVYGHLSCICQYELAEGLMECSTMNACIDTDVLFVMHRHLIS